LNIRHLTKSAGRLTSGEAQVVNVLVVVELNERYSRF